MLNELQSFCECNQQTKYQKKNTAQILERGRSQFVMSANTEVLTELSKIQQINIEKIRKQALCMKILFIYCKNTIKLHKCTAIIA